MTRRPWRNAWRIAVCLVAAGFVSPFDSRVAARPPVRTVDARVVGEPYRPRHPSARLALEDRADAATRILRARRRGTLSNWTYPALALGLGDDVIASASRRLAVGPDYEALVALSAAYLAPTSADDEAVRAALALDSAARATALAPARPEAWFNRAVALDALGFARWQDGWRDYLRVDDGGGWAIEADHRAPAAPAGSSPAAERHRVAVESEWLPAWAAAVGRDDAAGAAAALAAARAAAEQLVVATGDRAMLDLVQEIGADPAPAAAAIHLLARHDAWRQLDAGEPRAACAAVGAGDDATDGVGGMLDRLLVGGCRYYAGDHQGTRRVLNAAIVQAAGRGYAGLEGRLHYMAGAAAVRAGDPGAADVHYRAAVERLRQAGELGYLATARGILARRRHEQGDDASAWELLRAAFAETPTTASATIRYSIVSNALRIAQDGGHDGLALSFQTTLQQVAADSANATLVADALVQRAGTLAALGAPREAATALDAARAAVTRVTDDRVRPVSDALLHEAAARVAAASNPCAAGPLYEQAIAAASGRLAQNVPPLYRQLALALERCGRLAAAAAAYQAGIDALEAAVATHDDPTRRIGQTDRSWDLYGRLARLQATQFGDVEGGLLTLDRGRSVRLGAREVAGADRLRRLRDRLDGATALVYLVLDDETLVWTVDATSVVCRRLPVGTARLGALVAQWTRQVVGGLSDRAVGGELYRLLVAPVEPATRGPLTVVVPDGPLHALAFSALWTGSAYLVERTALWTALRLADVAPIAPPPRRAAPVRAVVVGGPALAPTSPLPPLPLAAAEAQAVARLYARAAVLTGPAATRSAVLGAMRDADVVHVAAHAVIRTARPFDSEIPLAGDESSALRVADLLALPRRPRVVVLASCRSAAGRPSGGFGAISLASALAGNAAAAIGTLWEIDDAQAPTMARELHGRLVAGEPVAMAVRAGQLAMLRRAGAEGATRVWAAMVGVGQPHTVVGE
ncbi:MAG: CHAT domain-containing protein [Vicinamibacterales bacterium]